MSSKPLYPEPASACMQTFNGKVYEAEPLRLWLDYHAFARAYDKHFGRYGLGAMPESVSYVCCAQFAVHRWVCAQCMLDDHSVRSAMSILAWLGQDKSSEGTSTGSFHSSPNSI